MAKGLDWTRTGTVEAMAAWLREKSDAICVLVIRPEDSVFAVDGNCPPGDAEQLVLDYLPRLTGRVEQARQQKKKAARLELGAMQE